MRPIPLVTISLSVVGGRGSGALFLPDGRAWKAVVTVDGVASTEIRISPSTAVLAALVGHYRRAWIPLPEWTRLTVAQIEESEARAMLRAQAAFADEVKEFATVEAWMWCCDDCRDDVGQRWCGDWCACRCHDDDDDDDDLDDGPCIGAECCNPSFDHGYSECVTAEQMAAYCADGEASADEEVAP